MSHSDYEWYYRVNLSAHLGRPVVPHRGPRLCLPACLPACLTLLWGFLVSQGKLGPKVAKARPPARHGGGNIAKNGNLHGRYQNGRLGWESASLGRTDQDGKLMLAELGRELHRERERERETPFPSKTKV